MFALVGIATAHIHSNDMDILKLILVVHFISPFPTELSPPLFSILFVVGVIFTQNYEGCISNYVTPYKVDINIFRGGGC